MARSRSQKKREENTRRVLSLIRLWLIAIALLLVVVIGAAELLSSGRAGAISERIFGTRDITSKAERLDAAIDDAMVRLHIRDVESEEWSRDTLGYATPHWETRGRIPLGASLYACNLELTKAVRGAGGRVARVRELDADWQGLRSLDMYFGLGKVETHHIVLKETERDAQDAQVVPERTEGAPRVAIIIDDFGYNMSEVTKGFFKLEEPITIAVLPLCPRTTAAANAAHEAGKQVLVHIPMQPERYPDVNPGDGALLERHTAEELKSLARAAIDDVPHACGANNHMGSRLTTRRPHMRAVMSELVSHGLFFVDSMTTARSVAYEEAQRAGVPAGRNTLFLDSYLDESGRLDVPGRLRELEAAARRNGFAIGIGHPKRETLDALKRGLPAMRSRGIDIVFVSELVQ
ncbi:divergent polysaccharide deacetylase family protein [bacterium]|nr:divergent polysaccharide deacetylase family protein [bacterium]